MRSVTVAQVEIERKGARKGEGKRDRARTQWLGSASHGLPPCSWEMLSVFLLPTEWELTSDHNDVSKRVRLAKRALGQLTLRKLGLDELDDQFLGLVGRHIGHQTERELADNLCRNDSLRTGVRERAFNTVERQAGVPHPAHERSLLLVADGRLGTSRAINIVKRKVHHVVSLALFVGERRDEIFDARNQDLALGSNEFGHDREEVGHGLVHYTAEYARVKITSWAGDCELVVVDATETVR